MNPEQRKREIIRIRDHIENLEYVLATLQGQLEICKAKLETLEELEPKAKGRSSRLSL
jgi:hypothetical protein